MSETCSHQCGECSADCAQRTAPEDLREKPNAMSKIKKDDPIEALKNENT